MEQLKTFIFIGPQGSGKGTQAQILAKKINAEYIEMGALLRETAQEQTEFGKQVKETIGAGKLVDDQTWKIVIDKKLKSLDSKTPAIFDGSPRRIGQAHLLIDYLKSIGRNRIATIYITLPKAESIKRLLGRGRQDDNEAAIKERLSLYEKDTLPVVEFLKNVSELDEIDGTPDIATVTKQIDKSLGL